MQEIENHHSNTTVLIVLGKSQRGMLKWIDANLKRNSVKVPPLHICTNNKRENSNFQCTNPADNTLAKRSRLTSPVIRQFDAMYPLIWRTEKGTLLPYILARNTQSQSSWEKTSDKSTLRTFHKIIHLTDEDRETVRDQRRLVSGTLDWILNQ